MKAILLTGAILIQLLLLSSFKEETDSADTIHFTVKFGNNDVGTLKAVKTIEAQKTIYNLQSEVKVGVLFLGVNEKIMDVFEKGTLSQSAHTRHINKGLKAHNTLVLEDGIYQLKNKEQEGKQLKESIMATVLTAYFKEPHHGQMLFSHNFQQLLPAKKIAESTYRVDLPDGNHTTYQYKNGLLQSVKSTSSWGLIQFVRN